MHRPKGHGTTKVVTTKDFEHGLFAPAGRFRLDGALGAGGMGIVYRAFDRHWQRHVALKMSAGRGARAVLRLSREFRALNGIRHPNLVVLYRLHDYPGDPFFTMELVEGSDFASYVRSGPCPTHLANLANLETTPCDSKGGDDSGFQQNCLDFAAEPLRLADQFHRLRMALKQLAEGLHALHDAGLLHCDVKPSNVLVSHAGRVVLVDFGSAIAMGDTEPSEADRCGTLAYMSPEQLARQRLSPASDWYSFGVMLYELLTGCLPFTGTAQEVAASQRIAAPSLTTLAADAPPDLVALCARLLHCDATQRPSGCEVLAVCEELAPQSLLSDRSCRSVCPHSTKRHWVSGPPLSWPPVPGLPVIP